MTITKVRPQVSSGVVKCKHCTWRVAMHRKGPFGQSAWHQLLIHYEDEHPDELNDILDQLGEPRHE